VEPSENQLRKPLLIFDGDCGFCRRWIEVWRARTHGLVEYEPYQEAARRFPQTSESEFRRCVWLYEPDGRVTRGAEAVYRALAFAPGSGGLLWKSYRALAPFRLFSEFAYSVVARHRGIFSRLDQATLGFSERQAGVSRIFLRALAFVYLAAFLSLGVQIQGLAGSNGILPAADFMKAVAGHYGAESFWKLPSLLWWSASDTTLSVLCYGGAALAAFAAAAMPVRALFFLLWFFYLSLSTATGIFLGYQWDALLLECGLLAVLLAPNSPQDRRAPPGAPAFLFRWLLFRLMLSSGLAKWQSGDVAWRSFDALKYHYETQPLPTPLAWYFHQMPDAFHRASAMAMFVVEIAVPFLIFGPAGLRRGAALVLIAFQILILATGNYCFFNLLTIALCLFLFVDDDFSLKKKNAATCAVQPTPKGAPTPRPLLERFAVIAMSVLIFTASLGHLAPRLGLAAGGPFLGAARLLAPLGSVSAYGLFSVMTTERFEIELEGSVDGVLWRRYDFRYKPDNLSERPRWVAPHQPRLDWQMWFAALSDYRRNPWFFKFCDKLFADSPQVRMLLARDPFDVPPKFLRATLYRTRFTTPTERKETGNWWKREEIGPYCPVLAAGKGS